MADQKISELTALTGANVADDDAIAIVDTSATETKKIVFSELKNALDTATGFVRITGDTMTGALTTTGLTSSGNLLVNVTSAQDFTSTTTNGHTLYGGSVNAALHSRNDANALAVQRTGTDGSLVNFFKATAEVGSIGTTGGDTITIGSGDTGLLMNQTNDEIIPWNTSTNAARDGFIDLGDASHHFKDLYLSGGIQFDSRSNKLDDYEEGTWTPAVSNMTVTGTLTTAGRYTKVGRMVSLMGWISATTSIAHSASALISGFPFAGATVTGENQSRSAGVIVAGANADLPSSNHSAACFVDSPNSRAFLGNFTTTAANEYIYINAVYYTA